LQRRRRIGLASQYPLVTLLLDQPQIDPASDPGLPLEPPHHSAHIVCGSTVSNELASNGLLPPPVSFGQVVGVHTELVAQRGKEREWGRLAEAPIEPSWVYIWHGYRLLRGAERAPARVP
jgi:hypothetical protein